jgi:Eukaryotic aspartyl protease
MYLSSGPTVDTLPALVTFRFSSMLMVTSYDFERSFDLPRDKMPPTYCRLHFFRLNTSGRFIYKMVLYSISAAMKTLALLSTLVFPAIFANAAPLDSADTSAPDEKEATYYKARNVINSFEYRHNQSSSSRKLGKRIVSNEQRVELATPFWLENGIPYIMAAVGTPPQLIELKLDTGSSWTWLMGPDSPESKAFKPEDSSTWRTNNEIVPLVDTRSCSTKNGSDILNIAGQILQNLSLGVGISQTRDGNSAPSSNCSQFRRGTLGLDRASDVLKSYLAQKELNAPAIFSLSYKDEETGLGENLFSLGGYAGLDPAQIIWMDHKNGKNNDHKYRVKAPYVSFKGDKLSSPWKHNVAIDTGASAGILPTKVLSQIYKKEPAFESVIFNIGKRAAAYYLFNRTSYPAGRVPVMAIKLGGTEWLSDLVDLDVEASQVLPDGQVLGPFRQPTFMSVAFIGSGWELETKDIPSIIGGSFLNKLKGLVFDFTPNKERVGFVPRYQLTSATGIINPLFVRSAASGRAQALHNKYFYIAASLVAMVVYKGLLF